MSFSDATITMNNNDFEKSIAELTKQFKMRGVKIIDLQTENERLKSERYKDEELVSMKKELDKAHTALLKGFPIYDSEETALRQWFADHIKDVPKEKQNRKAPAHRITTYTFEPTEIGVFKSIICSCGKTYCYNQHLI